MTKRELKIIIKDPLHTIDYFKEYDLYVHRCKEIEDCRTCKFNSTDNRCLLGDKDILTKKQVLFLKENYPEILI